MTKDEIDKLDGLEGWLLLVGLGVIATPIIMLINLVPMYMDIFDQRLLLLMLSPESGFYAPFLAVLMLVEMMVNVILFLAAIYLIYLFLSKHYKFPRFYIYFILVSLILLFVNAWLSSVLIPNQALFDEENTPEIIRSVIFTLIWVPYLIYSERVEDTFTRKKALEEAV